MTTCSDILSPSETHRNCRECAKTFTLPPFRLAAQFVRVCPECSERHAEADQRAALERAGLYRDESWKRICPPAFLDTEPHKLPSPSLLQRALQWRFGNRGLLLHGQTGRGKSRIAWHLLEREHKAGRGVAVVDCGFGYDYASRFAVNAADASRWLDAKMRVDVLLLDDTFKAKLTDSSEQALFVILNYRFEHRLPCIVTTNDVGETLAGRMSADRGAAMVRRLREFCDVISC